MTIDVPDKATEKPPLAGPIRRNRSALTYSGPAAVVFGVEDIVGATDEVVDLVCRKTITPPTTDKAAARLARERA
jgi:hypothetical protein